MPIIAENNGTNYTPIPAGNHIARCYEMIQIGTIVETTGLYAGKESHKVRLTWETPNELHDFGKGLHPFSISKEFTLSMNEKATLRKMLESWRGKAFSEDEAKRFDITKLLGVPCMVNVIHKKSGTGKDYADISSISVMPKGITCPAQVNQSRLLSFDEWNETIFESLPDYIKNKIKSSKEFGTLMHPDKTETPANQVEDGSDLPF